MTQKEKQLLLIDLCAKLPYGVILVDNNGDKMPLDYEGTIVKKKFITVLSEAIDEYGIKPYLRPMNSMTEEEENELRELGDWELISWLDAEEVCFCNLVIKYDTLFKLLDYLNEHHFDYRGLIAKGLALEATEGMYNTKQ